MPLQETSGNVTTDAYGGGVAAKPNYIEDVFSVWLYSGTGATLTVTNGIDISTNGGMVWVKDRTSGFGNYVVDTARGATNFLQTNVTTAQTNNSAFFSGFTTSGFTVETAAGTNNSYDAFSSWTFRKQPKFFDVVTYTGNGNSSQTYAHNLQSAPGCVFVKCTSSSGNWGVWHRGNGGSTDASGLSINTTGAALAPNDGVASGFTSTTFNPNLILSQPNTDVYNASGVTYVAYLFANNAGGFGLTGTDNVISCGLYTTDGSGVATVNLGFEPQWILGKCITANANWEIFDIVRGLNVNTTGTDERIRSNSAAIDFVKRYVISSTGFTQTNGVANADYIYIAIRRGPMKVPTDATTVFNLRTVTGITSAPLATIPGPDDAENVDMALLLNRGTSGSATNFVTAAISDRLRGFQNQNWPGSAPTTSPQLITSSTAAEVTSSAMYQSLQDTTFNANPSMYFTNGNTINEVSYVFKRAPKFFDVVCYTGTGGNLNLTHNLNAVPEIMIIKNRSAGGTTWTIYLNAFGPTKVIDLTTTPVYDATSNNVWNNTYPTSTQFTVGTYGDINTSGQNCVAYLFATCAGVSKVGTYTGNGSTQTINCGFTGGARFVLIKRTDASGSWYVYDTARGMTTLTDPYLLLNSTAAETATLGSVTTVSTGFALNSSILSAINTSGGTYIFLAIA